MSSTATLNLLKVKETLKSNYSGQQVAVVLDYLIAEAVRPILENSTIFNEAYAEILYLTQNNTRRKISSRNREDFLDDLFTFLVLDNSTPAFIEAKERVFKRFKIERQINFRIIKHFNDLTAKYMPTYKKWLACDDPAKKEFYEKILRNLESSINCKCNLFFLIKRVNYFLDLAYTFRGYIVEKYIRHGYNAAKKAIKSTTLHIDEDDLFKNIITDVINAIDKYNPDKGALTAHINWWLRNTLTQPKDSHEYGIAYSIPPAQRKKMLEEGLIDGLGFNNLAHSLEDEAQNVTDYSLSADLKLERIQESFNLYKLSHEVDSEGFACLLMEIPYNLSGDELRALQSQQ